MSRNCGVAVTIKNARGKGAAHVVHFAVRQSLNAAYDVKAALLDTDTDWNDKTQAVAHKENIKVVPADPCLEAMLLAFYDHPVYGKSSARLKQDFATRFGADATDPKVYATHFPQVRLEAVRLKSVELDGLLNLFVR